jgi:transposase-like protein
MERKERRHYTREFKVEAVRLSAVGDKTKAKVARELWHSSEPAAPVAPGL